MLILCDLVRMIWGANSVSVPMPDVLIGALEVRENYFPLFPLVILAAVFAAGAFLAGMAGASPHPMAR